MADEKLEPFKIGDVTRAGPIAPSKPKTKDQPEEQPEPVSLGFTRIETILDHESQDDIHARLNKIKNDLEAFALTAKAPKDKAAVDKARTALSHTLGLLDYLFETKARLIAAHSA